MIGYEKSIREPSENMNVTIDYHLCSDMINYGTMEYFHENNVPAFVRLFISIYAFHFYVIVRVTL